MGTLGQFDIDPKRQNTGTFGVDDDGLFMICDRCCGPCIYCATAPSAYLITLGGITLCPGWTGTTAGTYLVPYAGHGSNQTCSYIRRPAFTLYLNSVAHEFWIYASVAAASVRLRVLYDRNPYYEVFNNTLGNNILEPVDDCGMIGGTLTSIISSCNQITNGRYRAVGTGGWATFEEA